MPIVAVTRNTHNVGLIKRAHESSMMGVDITSTAPVFR